MPELKVPISADEIIEAVKRMKNKDREAFVEDLLAITSPDYLQSIREAMLRVGHRKEIYKLCSL
ncbi:MAG: hypothetical protein HYW13_04035 [Planctomycetes bacterium]|nr:hypothetical protein [Planctomycetota bacterium]